MHGDSERGDDRRSSVGGDELDHIRITGSGMQCRREPIEGWLVQVAQSLYK